MKILDCANPLYDSHKIGKEQGTDSHASYKVQAPGPIGIMSTHTL